MRIGELRALSTEELRRQLEETHRELFNLRFRLATRQLSNYSELPKAKKTIARIETLLREREHQG